LSRIAYIRNRAVRRLAEAFNRKGRAPYWIDLVPREAYRQDGLTTLHNRAFVHDAAFRSAYARAVRAGGWDYGIHWRVHVVLWAASIAERLPGVFIECGTGRGFMASAICERLGWTDRPFYLFDTFEPGLVTPDSEQRLDEHAPVYAHGADGVRENFREWPGVELVVGPIPDTLGSVELDAVAFLHIDLNHPAPEEAALRHLWPKLSPGALVVFDDYAYAGYEASHVSADAVAADLGFSILSLPTGQGLTIKR
jgi:hypothetical protein